MHTRELGPTILSREYREAEILDEPIEKRLEDEELATIRRKSARIPRFNRDAPHFFQSSQWSAAIAFEKKPIRRVVPSAVKANCHPSRYL